MGMSSPTTQRMMAALLNASDRDEMWSGFIDEYVHGTDQVGIHLAVLAKPYLELIMDGIKTIESRFSRNGCAPFGCVANGDVVLLKPSGGPVMGFFTVSGVWELKQRPFEVLHDILVDSGAEICAPEEFYTSLAHRGVEYATLMHIYGATSMPFLSIPKRDQRGWVVLRARRVKV